METVPGFACYDLFRLLRGLLRGFFRRGFLRGSGLERDGGDGFENVVKTTCFIADMADFAAFNKVYEKYFVSKPARSCVAVKQLPKNGLCEIEVIAENRGE